MSHHSFNLEVARNVLIEIIKTLSLPDNAHRLLEAKSNSGREMIKLMQLVFPIVMEIQTDVIKNYGFNGREGLILFEQQVREMEADEEIARFRQQIRSTYLPPVTTSTSPDVLI